MNEAIVKIKGQDPYIIRKEDIKNNSDFHNIINNIYCSTTDCDCKLTYVNSNRPHLRTLECIITSLNVNIQKKVLQKKKEKSRRNRLW